jgi:hypothetical protein
MTKSRFSRSNNRFDTIVRELVRHGWDCRVDVKEDSRKRWLFIVRGDCDNGRYYVVAARDALDAFRELRVQI